MYRVMYVIRGFECGIYGQGSTIEIADERAREFMNDHGIRFQAQGRVVLRWFDCDDRSSGWEVIEGDC